MKKITFILFATIFTSCTVTNYYQIYKANPENGVFSKDKIVFEDKNCSVKYNLWSDGGDIGFSVYNKTDNELTIDLTKTFFVINGVAYEYFQNRTFSKSSSNGTTLTSYPYYYYWYWQPSKVSGTNSTSYSTSFSEKPELTIPSNTMINISEYHISNSFYRNCELSKYPSRNSVKTLKFEKSGSPFVFYNIITYKTIGIISKMENKFYVSELTNIPETEMFIEKYKDDCGRKYDFPKKVFKDVSPDKFFVHYTAE